ncbi:tetratricopeptide repeat protein, partial [Myceligenerans crystallogenes]|uniref:tetratricopeptide repeat protein n=1 Tax=Myceligenerans crystallogenes TaxID=316335 RepID=UPI0031DBCEAA
MSLFNGPAWVPWARAAAFAVGVVTAAMGAFWHLQANKAAALAAAQEAQERAEAEARAEEARRTARASWVRIPVAPIGDLSPDAPLRLGVDAAAQDFLDGGRVPAYVPRDKDAAVRTAVQAAMADDSAPWLVLLHGHSKTGKSRTLYEALRATHDTRSALLVAPTSPISLHHILDDDEPVDQGKPAVLWLDDIEEFLFEHPLAMTDLHRWRQASNGRLVVGTLGGKGRAKSQHKAKQETVDLLSTIRSNPATIEIPLDRTTDRELEALDLPAKLREAIGPYGLAAYLVAGPLLMNKMRDQRTRHYDQKNPGGVALVEAAADWARCGRIDPISRDSLRALWPAYRREPDRIFDDADFDRAVEWACAPVDGETKLVIKDIDTDGFRAFDYTVHLIDTILRPDTEPTPAAWDLALATTAVDAKLAVGDAAFDRFDFNRAITVYDHVVEQCGNSPDPTIRTAVAQALVGKGAALGLLGRLDEAIAVCDDVVDRFADDPTPDIRTRVAKALVNKGITLGEQDRHDEAIALY